MCDVARDQRWGRGVEGGGEDPFLGGLFAAARVVGFQGKDFKSNEHFLACVKHFAAYGAAEAGLDYNTVDLSERTLREVYLKPYKAAFDAGALSAMASFNELSGIPGDRQPLADDRSAPRRMGIPRFRRVRLHGRRRDDQTRLRQGRARRGQARFPRRRRHEHAERPLSPAPARPGEEPAKCRRNCSTRPCGACWRRRRCSACSRIHSAASTRSAKRSRSMLPQQPRHRSRVRSQVDRHAEERRRPAASAALRQEDRADRSVRERPARPRRSVGRLWHGREGGRSRHRRPRCRRRQEQHHHRRGLEGRSGHSGRHRTGGRGCPAGGHRRARYRRNAGDVGRGPVARRHHYSEAAAGPGGGDCKDR